MVSNRLVSLYCLRPSKNAGAALDPTHHERGCHPARRSNPSAPRQGIKTASASRKIGRESSTLSPPANVDNARCRPRSTRWLDGAARQNTKTKNAGAALDPTHHERGCHPARRSNPSAPRQGIKTASASRKIGRESSTLSPPANVDNARCRPRSTRWLDGAARQNTKTKKAGAALDPTHHERGCHPARRSNPSAPRQGIKTASASRKIGRESSTLSPPANVDNARCRPRSTRWLDGAARQNTKTKKAGAALDPTHHERGCHPARRSNPSAPR